MPGKPASQDVSAWLSTHLAGKAVQANQYSVTEYFKQVHLHETQMPAIYFKYEMSPIRVELAAGSGLSFLHLLVKLAAVTGGVFALTSFTARLLPST